MTETIDLKKTVNLPRTDFAQKANLGQSEPARLKKWTEMGLYEKVIAARSGREKFIFTGDPLSPQNKKFLEARQLAIFRRGALAGLGPEISGLWEHGGAFVVGRGGWIGPVSRRAGVASSHVAWAAVEKQIIRRGGGWRGLGAAAGASRC